MLNCHNCKHEMVCIFHRTKSDIRRCPYYIPKNINIDISAFDTVPKDYALKKIYNATQNHSQLPGYNRILERRY